MKIKLVKIDLCKKNIFIKIVFYYNFTKNLILYFHIESIYLKTMKLFQNNFNFARKIIVELL